MEANPSASSSNAPSQVKVPIRPADRTRLARAFNEASRFWHGAHLYIEVVENEGAPCMDWRTISIPAKELEKPDEVLRATMFHEFGHRTISPGSPEISKVWQLLALKVLREEIRFRYPGEIVTDAHHLIVNMVTDLWIDRHYLENPVTAAFYAAATRHNIRGAGKRMEDAIGSKTKEIQGDSGVKADYGRGYGLFHLFLEIYQAILAETAHTSFVWKTPLAQKAHGIVFNEALPPEERIVEFTRAVVELIPVAPEFVALILVNGKVVDRTTDAYSVDKSRIIRLLRSKGAKPGGPEMKGVFGPKDGADLFAMIKEMELYARIIDTVELAHRLGSRRRQYAGFTRWRMGHRLPDLLFERSLERFGRVIPNVNTLKKNFMTIGNADENKGLAHICLIVDDSGSMGGEDRLTRLQESLFSLVLAAEKRGDSASLIVFGSGVTHTEKPSFDYRRLKRAIASLEGGSGGTVLAPAVQEAARLARMVERQTTFLFTDTEVFDKQADLRPELERLVPLSRLVLFAFSETEAEAVRFARRIPGRPPEVRAYFVKPGMHFFEETLKEVYHG
jgi:hypothetical protein